MLIQLRNQFRTTWRQVSTTTAAVLPRLSASEQTKLSWAKPIPSYAAVPDAYKDFFEPLRAAGRAFPYTVLTPSFEGFIHHTTEKLVCDLGDEIAVLERIGDAFDTQCYPINGISYVEIRTVLLDSRLRITGVTGQGHPASSTLRFNSVTDYLFTPILERMRYAGAGPEAAVEKPELEKFDGWVLLNYKFMNYARRSLLGGEKVLQALLQPEVRARRLALLGRTFYKTLAPALACILTDRELIVIRDDIRQAGGNRYGGIWDYIPLDRIASLSWNEQDDSLPALSIQLPGSAHLELLFQPAAKPEVDSLVDRFRDTTSRNHP